MDDRKTMMLTTGKKPEKVAKLLARRASDMKDPRPFKAMWYGESGIGKTYIVLQLLLMNFSVLYFSTEMGGDGLRTVTSGLKALNRLDLLENLLVVPPFVDYEAVSDFLQDPQSICPGLWCDTLDKRITSGEPTKKEAVPGFNPDFIFWDGFSEFQLLYLERYIADELQPDTPRAEREAGLFAVEKDWNMVMNGTLRGSHDFFQIRDPLTGREPHKIVTCKQAEKERDAVPGVDGKPLMKAKKTFILQGAAKKIFEGAFDFIFLATKRTSLKPNEPPSYVWRVEASEKQTAKVRGFELAGVERGEIPADFAALWSRLGLPRSGGEVKT